MYFRTTKHSLRLKKQRFIMVNMCLLSPYPVFISVFTCVLWNSKSFSWAEPQTLVASAGWVCFAPLCRLQGYSDYELWDHHKVVYGLYNNRKNYITSLSTSFLEQVARRKTVVKLCNISPTISSYVVSEWSLRPSRGKRASVSPKSIPLSESLHWSQ